MAKQLLTIVSLLVLQGVALSLAAPKSGSTAFDEWLATFDPSTAVASKTIICTGKPNGFYADEPDTCSATYYACVSGTPYAQKCTDVGNVFDSTVGACVDRYAAASKACEAYPAPACTSDNLGVYQPTEKCSDLYYICFVAGAQPIFQTCPAGEYLDPVKRICVTKSGADACLPPVEPPKVPEYTCSDKKTAGEAYATSKCSVSFYTCTSTTAQPTPGSCNSVTGVSGTVFDYTINPAVPATAASCKARSAVTECTSGLLATV